MSVKSCGTDNKSRVAQYDEVKMSITLSHQRPISNSAVSRSDILYKFGAQKSVATDGG